MVLVKRSPTVPLRWIHRRTSFDLFGSSRGSPGQACSTLMERSGSIMRRGLERGIARRGCAKRYSPRLDSFLWLATHRGALRGRDVVKAPFAAVSLRRAR